MTKIFMGIIGAMGLSFFLYYTFAVVPMKNKIEEQTAVILAQDLRDQEQKATIQSIQANLTRTTQAMAGLQASNQQYEIQMNEHLDIFRRHSITKLASAKPGLIELRANNRTKEVFDAIEEDSNRISSLND
jgi:hypothetical protein